MITRSRNYTNCHSAQGYQSSAVRYEDPVTAGTKVIVYARGQHVVIDRYVGHESFVGQTIYYLHREAVFGLNYSGAVLSRTPKADDIYGFLKRALAKSDREHRGPEYYKEGNFIYRNRLSSTDTTVVGEEFIEVSGEIVYRLDYRGHAIVDSRPPSIRTRNLKSSRSLLGAIRRLQEEVTRRSRSSPRRRRTSTTGSSE